MKLLVMQTYFDKIWHLLVTVRIVKGGGGEACAPCASPPPLIHLCEIRYQISMPSNFKGGGSCPSPQRGSQYKQSHIIANHTDIQLSSPTSIMAPPVLYLKVCDRVAISELKTHAPLHNALTQIPFIPYISYSCRPHAVHAIFLTSFPKSFKSIINTSEAVSITMMFGKRDPGGRQIRPDCHPATRFIILLFL